MTPRTKYVCYAGLTLGTAVMATMLDGDAKLGMLGMTLYCGTRAAWVACFEVWR